MKKKYRMIAVLLAAMLLFSAVPCYAASGAVVTGETVTTTAGKDIEYRVSITGNPGLVGYRLRIRYDSSALSLISCKQGDFTGSGTTTCGETDGGCNVFWYHSAEIASDGTLFVLKLHVSEAAEVGTYPITISSDAMYCVNYAEKPVPLSCVSGTVTVREFVPKIYGAVCEAKQGEELLYTVCIEDNPGIASYHVQVIFDANVLEYAADTFLLPEDGFAGGFQSKFYSNAFDAIWYSQADTTEEGALFSLRLKVKDNAAFGDSVVTVQAVPSDTLDVNEQPVVFECINGTVTVARKIEVTFPNAASATVTIEGTKGQIIVAALYDENMRQLAVAMKEIDAADAELKLTSTVSGQNCALCKVMTLDSAFRPICEAISVSRAV